jgi:hypothetical protein
MNITIEIHYKALSNGSRCGIFQLKGRKPETIAYQFWKEINKDMSYRAKLEKVLVNGNQDISESVIRLEDQAYRSINDNWNLPF